MVKISKSNESKWKKRLTMKIIAPIFLVSMCYNLGMPAAQLPSSTTYGLGQQQNEHRPKKISTVAYAISLIKCGDKQSTAAGLTDAALVLQHSVHLSHGNSKYGYKMFSLVHRNAEECSHILSDIGYEVVIVDSPIHPSEIQGDYLRTNVHKEWCCGSDEFIKLYAYSHFGPEHPIVIHTDIDFAFMKPMDNVFDAMYYPKDSPEGQLARSLLELDEKYAKFRTMPDRIDAFITRDWPQIVPGTRPPAYQAGFIVARHNPSVLNETIAIIREGNYSSGWGPKNGWGGLGYGGYVGGMAMQGLLAYYYDQFRPEVVVELSSCRYNHMGMDVLYRAHPNFRPNHPKVGQCRNNLGMECEDCTLTNTSLVYNVHYTQCRKPWNCVGVDAAGGTTPGGKNADAIDTNAGNFDHCMELISKWHHIRADFEHRLDVLSGGTDRLLKSSNNSTYKSDYFKGHCDGEGGKNYKNIVTEPSTIKLVKSMYQKGGA